MDFQFIYLNKLSCLNDNHKILHASEKIIKHVNQIS